MDSTSDTAARELLCFQVSGEDYATAIVNVREIRRWVTPTALPHAPDHMLGVINLRGVVLPVFDLARRLGLKASGPEHTRVIVVMDSGPQAVGLVVDAVSDIITVSEETTHPAPDMSAPGAQNCLDRITVLDDRIIRHLDLAAVLAPAQGEAA